MNRIQGADLKHGVSMVSGGDLDCAVHERDEVAEVVFEDSVVEGLA